MCGPHGGRQVRHGPPPGHGLADLCPGRRAFRARYDVAELRGGARGELRRGGHGRARDGREALDGGDGAADGSQGLMRGRGAQRGQGRHVGVCQSLDGRAAAGHGGHGAVRPDGQRGAGDTR